MQKARAPSRDVFGLLLLDKPAGLSSNQALQRAKRLFQAAKAGHTGSLDPLATGMLPIFFGAATRLASYLLDSRKVYRVEATLGAATDTGDREGIVTRDVSGEGPPDPKRLADALAAFVGTIDQVPPMFSALKRGGVPLYRLARAGQEVAREARSVVIEELTVEHYSWPTLALRVRCSKGTYVRTLVEDIAKAAGTLGHVAELRRLGVDPFQSHPMHSLTDLEAVAAGGLAALDECLLRPDAALLGWPEVHLADAVAARLSHGQSVSADPAWLCGATRVYAESGRFIALATVTADGQLVPERVFPR